MTAWLIILWQIAGAGGHSLELIPARECQAQLQLAAYVVHQAKEQGIPVSHAAACYPAGDEVAGR